MHTEVLSKARSQVAWPSGLADRLLATRRYSRELASPLSAEDQVVQAMEDASPTKWHLAHTTWFFETFVLSLYAPGYRIFDERFGYCFNSYYEAAGPRHPRPQRGLLTRPTVDEVLSWRQHVDEALARLAHGEHDEVVAGLLELGIHHEQQHQELMLMDILALFAASPLSPAYRSPRPALHGSAPAAREGYVEHRGGIVEIGFAGGGFAYDNEGPRHQALLQPFELARGLVSNGLWLEFMNDGGYQKPALWLADGWQKVRTEGWQAPGYWSDRDGCWHQMTLEGLLPVAAADPVCHVSFYEADAFARWAGKRLPTEQEWEAVSAGGFAGDEAVASSAPVSAAQLRARAGGDASGSGESPSQMFGSVWQWTGSAYLPYPGYRPVEGAIGEYNGKFMCNQQTLRGSACITPPGHARASYRNFFYPHQRWQFAGVRLAKEAT